MRAVVAHAAKDLRVEPAPPPELGPTDVRVRVAFGGICGSDLHYYRHGGFGVVRIREPLILGHEASGVIDAVGSNVTRVKPGDRIAINPSLPCKTCRYCQEGHQNQCLNMRFYGSAMPFPHMQGAFREALVCEESRAVLIDDALSLEEAAMAEPFAVALHAARQAGPLLGKRVLVTGAGPIGTLAAIAARRAGAAEIVVTDIADAPLGIVAKLAADRIVNTAREPDALPAYGADKGYFDVLFEASGAEPALRAALDVVRPGGVLVQLGLGGEMKLPINQIVAKEHQIRGTFRFHEEFPLALELMAKKLVNLKPLLTATFPIEQAVAAFDLAGDRSQSMKVQIRF